MQPGKYGFTLVEILIVVLLLSIIAMIAIPKFSVASDDAQNTALESNLGLVRRAIEVYRAQHLGRLPHLDENGDAATDDLIVRLTGRTDESGKINPTGTRGPYLSEWPANEYVAADVAVKVACGASAAPRDDSTGWYYCTATGMVHVNSSEGALTIDPPTAE